ncbi:hypothetical protein J2X03_003785 [Microbacterium trichothecenolyticum]|uniref:hypothetical protein n=1 Tax=Microbacterium trichothecenolyticum TaxID=69370 RepID=UPI00285F8A15|nr:hypothetical protein [Microbacterium trichothecenolyticum]MDR7113883.1 hypothetical protein [Microbacterium trichothecenolyticum]
MTTIAVKPLVLKDVLLKIATDNYEKHVSGVSWVPTAAQIQWQGLTPDAVFSDVANATWALTLNYVQDWETEDSLAQYLFEHEGETIEMVFTPVKGTGKKTFTADVTITPGQIGGEVNAYATTSVTLGSTKPVIGTVA